MILGSCDVRMVVFKIRRDHRARLVKCILAR